MVNALDNAMIAARRAIESRYTGLCTVIERQQVKDERTKVTSLKDVTVLSNCPCRLSYSSKKAVNQTDTAASIDQTIVLFTAPEIAIKAGSKVIVTQNGATVEYKASGVPAVYETHQEVMLELFKEWA